MRYLVTGGAGFIGSHLVDALTGRGDVVLVLDDLSTGSLEHLTGALQTGRVRFVEGSVCDEDLVLECLEQVDVCLHLASAVGVKLIVDRPLETLLRNVRGSDIVLSAAAGLGRKVLYASTSEIYGKNSDGALHEGSDRLLGAPQTSRWSYSTAKAFGEALAFGYHREVGNDVRVVRLFNTVGPRQTGTYGMVLPRFVRQALAGEDLTVYGDGTQSRCFAHVADVVRGILLVLDAPGAAGEVFNLGATHEVAILELAGRVIGRTGSPSRIRLTPFEDAYQPGFEELGRRQPDTSAVHRLTGWAPELTIDDAIDDVVRHERALLGFAERTLRVA